MMRSQTFQVPAEPYSNSQVSTGYEVSAFAKPGRECRHNLHYWQFDDYLGIGAGAHGK